MCHLKTRTEAWFGVKVWGVTLLRITSFVALDFLTCHFLTQFLLAPDKQLMEVSPAILRTPVFHSYESIDMKLALKGPVFCSGEISWHDDFGKFFLFMDFECPTMRLPRDNIFISFLDSILEHFVYRERKSELFLIE